MRNKIFSGMLLGILCTLSITLRAQIQKAPERKEGDGQYSQLIIRGVTLINGTGAPAYGPVDIVIEKNRIVQIASLGNPAGKINPARRPKLKELIS